MTMNLKLPTIPIEVRLSLMCGLLFAAVFTPFSAASPWIFHDPVFRTAIERPNAQLEFLAGGFNGCEGPAWIASADEPDGGYLRFGAVHTDVAFRWDSQFGLRGLRSPSNEASAFQPYPDGATIVAEQRTRRLVRYEPDGRVTILVDSWQGKRLNRPNDLRVKSDGTIWFTDPDYLYKQRPHEIKELPGQYVFRLDPVTRELNPVETGLTLPNGIAFSPDETLLYIGDSGSGAVDRWQVNPDGSLGPRQPFVRPRHGTPDGVTCDAQGNVWIAGGRAVEVFSRSGRLLAELPLPGKRPAATAFGGSRGEWLFVCTREAVYRLAIIPLH